MCHATGAFQTVSGAMYFPLYSIVASQVNHLLIASNLLFEKLHLAVLVVL
jgi:hypothetical protein